jgi:hypothetical protein
MLPLEIREHSLVMRIVRESMSHPSLKARSEWIEMKLFRDEELIQSVQESIGTFQFSVSDFLAFAAALPEGKAGWYGDHSYIHGNRIKLRGKAPAGLSWRKATVAEWLVPFFANWQEVYLPGSFVQAIGAVAGFLQANHSSPPQVPSDGVGMPVAQHPLHRSVRAELPHTAPASGSNDQTPQK